MLTSPEFKQHRYTKRLTNLPSSEVKNDVIDNRVGTNRLESGRNSIPFHQPPPSPTTSSSSTTASNVRHVRSFRAIFPSRSSSLTSSETSSPPNSLPPDEPLPALPSPRSDHSSTPTSSTHRSSISNTSIAGRVKQDKMDDDFDNALEAITAFPASIDGMQQDNRSQVESRGHASYDHQDQPHQSPYLKQDNSANDQQQHNITNGSTVGGVQQHVGGNGLQGRPFTPAASKSTDTFGNRYSGQSRGSNASPLPPLPNGSIHMNKFEGSRKSDSVRESEVEEEEEEEDSDEYPYSDSDLETEKAPHGLRNDAQQRGAMIRNHSQNGHNSKRVAAIKSSSTQNTNDFPKPPRREGDLTPVQEQQQRSFVGGLSAGQKDGGARIQRRNEFGSSALAPPISSKPGYGNTMVRDLEETSSENGSSKSVYRKAGLRSDLSAWAPSAKPPMEGWGGISNLPDWKTIRAGDPTSMPIVHVQRDLDWSMRKLMTEGVFEQLVNDPLGRHRFREFLAQKTGTENKLDMYFDLTQYTKQNEAIRQASETLHDIYLAEDSDGHVPLPTDMSEDFYDTIKRQFEVKASLGPIQQHLLRSLYKNEFQIFVKAQLIEHNRVKLGSFADDETERSGLGDCYCLTNPRLRENPIVLVSPGFEKVTGYPRQQIIGRNCRFLQGPGTAPDSVQRIRDALNSGESCTELLLNYTRDGTPFFCLLSIIPLRDATGTLVYFIGGQTNVNGQLANSKGLRFLMGGGDPNDAFVSQGSLVNGLEVSPTVAIYLQGINGTTSDLSTTVSGSSDLHSSKNADNKSIRTKRGMAAGSYDPANRKGPIYSPEAPAAMLDSGFEKSQKKQSAVSRLFGRSPKPVKDRSNLWSLEGSQRLLGAEGAMRKESHTLEDQMEYFTALYSKAIIFKRTKREIIFATRECIAFFDLPVDTWKDVYASPLVHADLLSIIEGTDKEETKSIQHAIQAAVRKGESISVQTGIKRPKTKKRFYSNVATDWISGAELTKFTTIHITPLRDRDNSSFAFVAVVA